MNKKSLEILENLHAKLVREQKYDVAAIILEDILDMEMEIEKLERRWKTILL